MKIQIRVIPSMLILILLLGSLGLAVPEITVNVQELGSGAGEILSPTSEGTICVPYAYAYYLLGRWFGPYPLNNIPEVYPGNFTEDLYPGTNISVGVYNASNLISKGVKTLSSTLQAGYYTNVSINPPLNSNQVLNSEFKVTVQPNNYTSSLSGIVHLLVQKLGVGIGSSAGIYNDYAVLVYDGGFYQIYIILRCYTLPFEPPVSSAGAVSLASAVLLPDKVMPLPEDIQDDDFRHGRECHYKGLGNLPSILWNSPFIKDVVREAMDNIMESINSSNT